MFENADQSVTDCKFFFFLILQSIFIHIFKRSYQKRSSASFSYTLHFFFFVIKPRFSHQYESIISYYDRYC